MKKTGLSRKTIRLYEEKGLLAPRKIRILRLLALILMLFFGYVALQFYLMGANGVPVVIVWCVFVLAAAAFVGACVAAAISKKHF